jgi:hypothetical protein
VTTYRGRDKYSALYRLLENAETENRPVTRDFIAKETGYAPGTVGAYIRNRLKNVFLYATTSGGYRVDGVAGMSYESFAYHMSQKSHAPGAEAGSLDRLLALRSIEALYAALAAYNNPLSVYRAETFCILACNAWELLLKARIIDTASNDHAILRKDGKTISFTKAIQLIYGSTDDPVRRNLERLNELRDQAVHLLVPEIQNTLSRLFQAAVFNYLRTIDAFGYPNPHARQLPGLLSLVSDAVDADVGAIESHYGKLTAKRIVTFLDRVSKEEDYLGSAAFAIPVNYHVILSKNEQEGDMRVSLGPDGVSAMVIEVAKDHNKTHPHRQKDVIELLNARLEKFGRSERWNNHSFQGMLLKEGIRKPHETPFYHHIERPETHTYSDRLVDFIENKQSQNQRYIELCHEVWSKKLAERRLSPHP